MYVCTCECKHVHPSRGKGSTSGVFSLYFLPLFFKTGSFTEAGDVLSAQGFRHTVSDTYLCMSPRKLTHIITLSTGGSPSALHMSVSVGEDRQTKGQRQSEICMCVSVHA